MKIMTKKLLLINITLVLFLLTACGIKQENGAEYKLKASMEIQNVEAAKEAIDEGVDVNKFSDKKLWERTDKGSFELNPTRIAIFTGCYDVAKILIENGADVNYEDVDGASLIQATSKRDEQLIKFLVENGADINKVCKNGKTALEYAIANQNWQAVKLILKYNPKIRKKTVDELVNACDHNYNKLWQGFDEIKELLKSAEFKDCKLHDLFSQKDVTDLLSLYIEVAFGTLENVTKGLERFPECDIGQLCECATLYGNTDVLKYLVDIEPGINTIELWEQSLSIASEHDDVKMIDFILSQAENIDVGKAMQVAAVNNSQKVIERLLEYGFNPNEPVNGHSLLETACFYGNLQIVKILIQNGSGNGINNGEPLSVAARRGYIEIVQYLIESGANVNGNNTFSDGSGGESVLMYAIKGGQLDCIKLLIKNGADVNYEYSNNSGSDSVLESAKKCTSDRIYQYLLERS